MTRIAANTWVSTSERGHRGFIYPSHCWRKLEREVEAERLSLFCGENDLDPYLISERDRELLYLPGRIIWIVR